MTATRFLTGADQLRAIVRAMGDVPEWFNDRYSAQELVRIYSALFASEWDISPHEWAPEQVEAAARANVVPRFDDNGRPLR